MEKAICTQCQKPKAQLTCGTCQDAVCKYCAQFVDEDRFSFFAQRPEELTHSVFCYTCFDTKVAPQMEIYDQLMERAKGVHIFDRTQGKETRLFKRLEEPLKVEDCIDSKEIVLRLAFLAVQKDCNSIVDMDLKSKKIKTGSRQTTSWTVTGIPTHVDMAKLEKDRSLWHQPN